MCVCVCVWGRGGHCCHRCLFQKVSLGRGSTEKHSAEAAMEAWGVEKRRHDAVGVRGITNSALALCFRLRKYARDPATEAARA